MNCGTVPKCHFSNQTAVSLTILFFSLIYVVGDKIIICNANLNNTCSNGNI